MAKRRTRSRAAKQAMLPRERCRLFGDRRSAAAQAAGRRAARLLDRSSISKSGTSASRWRGRCCAPPTGVTLLPDVPNWSWHEYGMRVGVWRFFELFKRQNIRPTLAINARVCEDYPRVAAGAANDAGNSWAMPIAGPDPQGATTRTRMIARSLDVVERFTGKRPVGWLGPGLTRDARDAGSARRRRRQIYRRLGL